MEGGKVRTHIFRDAKDYDEMKARYDTVHVKGKKRLLFPLYKLLGWLFKKFLVKSDKDIPREGFNNYIRIWYYSMHKGLHDMWTKMYYKLEDPNEAYRFGLHYNQKGRTSEQFYQTYVKDKKGRAYKSNDIREMLINLATTVMLEDTVDREWFNMAILTMTHEVMKHHGVMLSEMEKVPKPGEFPMYTSFVGNDIEYFLKTYKLKVWEEPQ